MKYANLGHTGLRVSRICLGCMSYGTPKWRPWVLDEEAAQPFFRRAVELGVTFFDTANMYSDGVSEEVTGRALRRYAKMDEVVLATKVYFPTGSGQNERGLSRKNITQACEASLKRLGVETIDLYQIHRMDPNTPIEETLSALDQLVRQGKVRYLGASSSYAWQFARALGVSERNGWAKFVSMQDHYNLVYREEEREMLPLCEAEGIGVIPWSPLARGLLTGSRKSLDDREATTRAGSDTLSPVLYNQAGDWDVVEAVKKVAEARKAPPAQVALAWLLSKPVVTAPIIGATKPEHLEDAVKAVTLKLAPEEIKALEAPYKPHEVRGM
ncbi:aldo/keto reductase [Corallococcus praedator]|uniref:Aldo/keto reductase n=1 Tax=Corallococcus praedator TaxID=2316724 RepID=A0ABX9QDX8_9BACT|nr:MULTISPECIES: aldo/keto reductase [Corallococcus]RKH14197.1 aldo/keto reductase [Corallococcus sp. CA047B]RKH31872.1 aldo/keto reductase [Corallococcus sp. CA031C]RKI00636.1 aldo/keto reductase [Corallococcus praedator]